MADRDLGRKIKTVDIVVLSVLAIYFFAILISDGVRMYNDSEQYIVMHVRREPLYPVFLWIIRQVSGDIWLTVTGIVQTLIVIAASFRFITYISKRFNLNTVCELLVCVFTMLPYIVTPLASVTRVQMSSAIMSESIALPLFLLFFVYAHKAVCDRKFADLIISYVIAFALALIRSNMMIVLIAWVIISIIVSVGIKKALWAVICTVLFVCSFPMKDLCTKGYNLAFNGRFVGNQYANVTMLANILYATDEDAKESIENDTLEFVFELIYFAADSNGLTYKDGGNNAWERAAYLEEVHDRIKYDVLEYGFRDINEYNGIHDYIDYNAKAEEFAGQYRKELWPLCFARWFAHYLALGTRGMIRSIAVIHPAAYVYAALAYALAVICMIACFKKSREDDSLKGAGWLLFVSMLLILGNAYGTAALIMCLSRYMVYGFPIFYSSLLCGCVLLYRRRISVND